MRDYEIFQPVAQQFVYESNVARLKKYNDNNYKIVYMKSCRQVGFEERKEDSEKGKKNTAGNTSKLDESLSRTRARVFDLAICNPWDYFITLTLSPDEHDRYDLRAFYKQLTKWINNLNYRNGTSIKYLLIPEPHDDGAWHMHGFIHGIPDEALEDFIPGKHPQDLIDNGFKNWTAYSEKFGFCSLGHLRNAEACSKYITKYITKALGQSAIALNHHMYYCSKGLKRAETVVKGHLSKEFEPDFANDYVAIKSFKSLDEALAFFIDDDEIREPVTFNGLISSFMQRRESPWTACLQT